MKDEEVHMRARSAYLSGPHNLELRDVDLPEIHGQLVLVKIKAAGICGSGIIDTMAQLYLAGVINEGVPPPK